MTFTLHQHALTGDTPGLSHTLSYYSVGPEAAPTRVHLQAALHADEQPGTMALHHLLPMLCAADAEGRLQAHFSVFPSVNPLGLATRVMRRSIGRYDLETGLNFNRRWPDLYSAIAPHFEGHWSQNPADNVRRIRAACKKWIAAQDPSSAAQILRLLVLRSAVAADIVLDLHCDDDSLSHIFTSPEFAESFQPLADCMQVAATLTAEDSGGGSFDEVLPNLFRKAQAANPNYPIPMATETATLEYRGQADVSDDLGQVDAQGLYDFFVLRGLIQGTAGNHPRTPRATPFEATEVVRAPAPGLLAYRVDLGQQIVKGDVVADLIAMDGPNAFLDRSPICASTDGFVLSKASAKLVSRGATVAKIVGTEPLSGRVGAYLLED